MSYFTNSEEYTFCVGDAEFVFLISAQQVEKPITRSSAKSHAHQHNEILYVINGSVDIHTDQKSALLTGGDAVLIPAGTVHSTSMQELTHYICIGYTVKKRKTSEAPGYADAFLSLIQNDIAIVKDFDRFDCFKRLMLYQNQGFSHSKQLVIACAQEMIFLLKNALADTQTNLVMQIPAEKINYRNAYIDQYINANYNKKASLEELAGILYVSTQQLQRIIKKLYRQSFRERILFLRMENAKRLLKEESISAKTVALRVGYESPQSFFAAFKKATGMTPKEYQGKAGEDEKHFAFPL